MASPTVLSGVLHSTMETNRKDLILAYTTTTALYSYLFANNRVVYEAGGYEIKNPLVVGRNPTVQSYRYYGRLPVAPTDEFSSVRYNFARVAGTAIISEQEIDENEGPAQIFNLMKQKLEILKESIREKFSDYVYGHGLGTDPNGLGNLIPDNPNVGSLGGLDRATEPYWRTSAYDFNGTLDSTSIEEAFDDILLDLTQGNEKPDLILVGRNIYRMYRAAVRSKQIITLQMGGDASKRVADLGFEGVKHANTTILYDEACDPDKAYFINTKYLKPHVFRKRDMKPKKLTAPWDMDAVGERIVWQGQLCMWKAYRTHAVLINK